ncbi:MAG: hypothetical protein E6G53_06805 [Actinobacteria bacterium]|nr:MAG: hypothetical protein E6G53_06805 [Actinomycetota bacterium]
MKRFNRGIRSLAVAAVAAGAVAAPVYAGCGDGWMGTNLVATPSVKAALRSAYLAGHPKLAPAEVTLLPGRTYYGAYSGTRYAVATLAVGSAPASPTIFRTDQRGRWQVRRQTHGAVCTDVVPIDLIRAWWLTHYSGRCYVEPSH